MATSTTTAGTTAFRPTAQGTAARDAAAEGSAGLGIEHGRRGRALRVLGVALLGVVVVAGTSAWALSHRGHRPLPATAAMSAAVAWCSYNFPPPHDARTADPNLNTSACRLGFLDGAANPDAESTPEERRIAVAESTVGATNPQGLWDIAYLAGWTAGHDAARSA